MCGARLSRASARRARENGGHVGGVSAAASRAPLRGGGSDYLIAGSDHKRRGRARGPRGRGGRGERTGKVREGRARESVLCGWVNGLSRPPLRPHRHSRCAVSREALMLSPRRPRRAREARAGARAGEQRAQARGRSGPGGCPSSVLLLQSHPLAHLAARTAADALLPMAARDQTRESGKPPL